MAEKVTAGPITSANGVREAVCIHTKKIFSSCKDKDCIEDLRVYLTAGSQELLDTAANVRVRSAELIHTDIDVEPVAFDREDRAARREPGHPSIGLQDSLCRQWPEVLKGGSGLRFLLKLSKKIS